MAQKHPPLDLVNKWRQEWLDKPEIRPNRDIWMTSQAAQWAAEQQFETCLKWLEDRMALPPEELEGIMSSFRATLTQSPPKSVTHPHSITPPTKLVEQWTESAKYKEGMPYPEGYEEYEKRLATMAARWGADQELEACCEWMKGYFHDGSQLCKQLRNARRPKPPSLKEQALEQLRALDQYGALDCNTDKIRRALEALPND